MPQVTIAINGRNFTISCEEGQEQRVTDLSHYVDSRLKNIAQAGAASNDAHLLVLTSLLLADEVFDLRQNVGAISENLQGAQANQNEEAAVASAIEDLADRIDRIASRIQSA